MDGKMDRPAGSDPGLELKQKKIAKEDQACHITISCGHPNADGKIPVEMSYEGDPSLASYLLESAQGFIELEDDSLCN